MSNGEKIDNIVNPALETITFGGKEFVVRRLSVKAVLKIASIVSGLGTALNLGGYIDKEGEKKLDLSFLQYIDDKEVNEVIALVLKTSVEEVEDLFNLEDFLKLVGIVVKQEDLQRLFLEVRQLTETVKQKTV